MSEVLNPWCNTQILPLKVLFLTSAFGFFPKNFVFFGFFVEPTDHRNNFYRKIHDFPTEGLSGLKIARCLAKYPEWRVVVKEVQVFDF